LHELLHGHVEVGDTPEADGANASVAAGVEPQLVPTEIEAHIEGLIEVRLDPEHLREPRLGSR
jgi:hypothetical protein